MATAFELPIVRLTTSQFHAMVEAGILREGDPIELLDGLLVRKDRSARGADPMTIGEKHNLVVKLLARRDLEFTAHGSHMQTPGPVTLGPHDEPEPDAAVLRGEPRDYLARLPAAADALAVIEVADSSLEIDRTRKLALSARAGIEQYLIVNLRDCSVEVHEAPAPGVQRYDRVTVLGPGDVLSLRTAAEHPLTIEVSRILP